MSETSANRKVASIPGARDAAFGASTSEPAKKFRDLLRDAEAVSPVRPDEPDNSNQNDRPNHLIEFMEVLAQVIPVLPSFHPKVSQSQTPRERPHERV